MQLKILFRSDGHLTDEAMCHYVDALKIKTTEDLSVEIRDHVESCLECKRSILELYDLVKDQDYESLRPHPYFDQKKTSTFTRITNRIMRLAAAIVIGVGLLLVAYLYFGDRDTSFVMDESLEKPEFVEPEHPEPYPPEIREPEIIPREEVDVGELYAANFEPSPFYEILVDQRVRAPLVRALTPSVGEEVAGDIYFSWETTHRGPFHLKILDNTENEVHRITTETRSYLWTADLVPGLYYWRLETDAELLYVGKFVVPLP